jgi:hypothetical protein
MWPIQNDQANICWWFIMAEFSLVPVDHQPDFSDVSLVPVDHDPFSADDETQRVEIQQAQAQPAQSQPESLPHQPATGVGQPDVGAPGNADRGLLNGGPNPALDQGGSAEPAPFSGHANPSPTESLVNRQKMEDQLRIIAAHPNGDEGNDTDGRELYRFVTTKRPIARYLINGGTGNVFTEISPFYAYDGTRYAFIDASQERPVTVTVTEDGKFTISRR